MAIRLVAIIAVAGLAAGAAQAGVHILHNSPEPHDPMAPPVIGSPDGVPARVGLTVPGASNRAPPPEPRRGQPGKDVVWTPTSVDMVAALLQAARVAPGDHVLDLGSGDGRIPIAAARDFGARARGIEYNPALVSLARQNAERAGVADRVVFVQGDLFDADFGDASVVSMYLLPGLNRRLQSRLLALAPGTRIVSNSFPIGDWPPDRVIRADDGVGYLWVVPAKVAGRWAFEVGDRRFTATIRQNFQMLRLDGGQLRSGRMDGIEVRLQRANGPALSGSVSGDEMVGDGWIATRIPAPAPSR